MNDLATLAVQIIPVDLIEASPLNPRKAFPPEKLQALGESMQARGQLEALTVRPHPSQPGRYELANGERRWRAARQVGMAKLAARVREMDDATMVEVALASGAGDNVESLNAYEEAIGYAKLMKLRGWDQRAMAQHVGRSATHVMQRLALLELKGKAKAALESGRLAARTAYYIASIPGEKAREEAAEAILHSEIHGGPMPEGAALNYIRDHVCRPLRSAPFEQKDAELLPRAGACVNCRFRAGNNAEEYGDVFDPKKGGGVDRCMHPACFDEKVSAHRERLLSKHAVGGKVALAPEENVRVFPREEHGIHFASEFVEYNAKPTPDILKKEVSPSAAPTWRELTEGAPVTVYVGVDQGGRVVDLVKRDEAIASADLAERKIFNESQVKRGTAAKPAKSAADAPSASRAEEEKSEKQAKEKAERARRRKDKAAGAWLVELAGVMGEAGPARRCWHGLPYWSLVYELAAAALSVEEVAFVVGAVDPESGEKERGRAALDAYAGRLALGDLVALVSCLLLAARVREEGADGPLVKQWHESIVLAAEAVPEPAGGLGSGAMEEKERALLTQVAKAHMEGMSVHKIARTFRMTRGYVCVMLELDQDAVEAEWASLDRSLGESLARAGVKPAAETGVIRGLLGFAGLTRADLAPEEIRALLEALDRAAKAAQPAAVPPTEEVGSVESEEGGVDSD